MAEKKTEWLKYETKEGETVAFPVAAVTGTEPGPVVVITAGIHGCEYPGIASAIRLFKELDPEKMKGTVKIVTVTSVAAFEKRNPFVSPADGKNPNRFFPGDPEGSYTEVLAWHLLHDVIIGADYYLDLHGGDLVEALEPFSIFHQGAEVDEKSRELAEYYGLPNMVSTTWDGEWPDKGTTYANAAVRGIPAAIVEAGGIGQMDEESIHKHMEGLYNVLRYVGVLEGEAVKKDVTFYEGFHWVYTPWAGIYYNHVKVGTVVEKGSVLGHVEDYFGNLQGEVLAPVTGKVVFLETTPAMGANSLICGIAY